MTTKNTQTDSGSAQAGLSSGENHEATSDQTIEPTNASPAVEAQSLGGSITIVIPYRHSSAAGDELLYAIRAWQKFYPNGTIVLIGDLHPKLKKPSKSKSAGLRHIPFEDPTKNPQINAAHKMLAAIESNEVSEYFIWTNDDIYPLCPLTLSDLDIVTAMGPLKPRGAKGGIYRENSERTAKALKEAGIAKAFDFATHTPVGFFKDQLREVIESFQAAEQGHLVSTLYFNTLYQDIRPILVDTGINRNDPGTQSYVASVYRKVSPEVLKTALTERKFINHNDAGWTSVAPFLKKLFPDKSSFEK